MPPPTPTPAAPALLQAQICARLPPALCASRACVRVVPTVLGRRSEARAAMKFAKEERVRVVSNPGKDEQGRACSCKDEHTLGPDDAFATMQAGKEARRTRQRAVVRARAWTSPGRMAGLPFCRWFVQRAPVIEYESIRLLRCTTKGAKKTQRTHHQRDATKKGIPREREPRLFNKSREVRGFPKRCGFSLTVYCFSHGKTINSERETTSFRFWKATSIYRTILCGE